MELSLDTRTKLGVLKSRRAFTIDDLAWDKLLASHSSATPARAAAIQRQLASNYNRRFIMSGQSIEAKDAVVEGLSGKVTWYADKTALKVRVQVADSGFASCTAEEISQGRAYLTVQTAAPGSKGSIDLCQVVPMNSDGKATIYGKEDATATWKRTGSGYDVDVKLPWNRIAGYKPSMKLLPVQVAVNSITADAVPKSVTTGSKDEAGARAFAILKLKQ